MISGYSATKWPKRKRSSVVKRNDPERLSQSFSTRVVSHISAEQ